MLNTNIKGVNLKHDSRGDLHENSAYKNHEKGHEITFFHHVAKLKKKTL